VGLIAISAGWFFGLPFSIRFPKTHLRQDKVPGLNPRFGRLSLISGELLGYFSLYGFLLFAIFVLYGGS
jgi:hypothetical protein